MAELYYRDFTSPEQSAELVRAGIDPESADMKYEVKCFVNGNKVRTVTARPFLYDEGCAPAKLESADIPSWSLGRLLQLLPKPIRMDDTTFAYPVLRSFSHALSFDVGMAEYKQFMGDTDVDAAVKAMLWVLGDDRNKNHLNYERR